MYLIEATDVPNSNLSDQITQQHCRDARHFVDPMSFFVSRVRLRNRKRFIFSPIFEAADCMLLKIWQVCNLLERLPELNSFTGGVGNKNWQIWKTQLCCFQSPLYFVGLRISSGRFLKVRQKRPRTNKYLRKRMHSLILIFDFHPRALHMTCICFTKWSKKET